MASIEELKQRIDLHDLANRLGLERPDPEGNYRSPTHEDKTASLSIYLNHGKHGTGWKDHSTNEGGSCIDLVIYCGQAETVGEAVKFLHQMYGFEVDTRRQEESEQRGQSLAEFIAGRCYANLDRAVGYLASRGIAEEVIKRAIDRKAVGFNDYTSPKKEPNTHGHGGPGVAFIVRSLNPGHVVAVETRYFDPALNGGTKTQTQGEKVGAPWFIDRQSLAAAHTVHLVESPINALSIESCGLSKGEVAVAVRGAESIVSSHAAIDWTWLKGKRVNLCMDNDAPNEKTGFPPGARAAWAILEQLTAQNIAASIVDQSEWGEINDCNDVLKDLGADELRKFIRTPQRTLIYGMASNSEKQKGQPRVWLPPHDFAQYFRYRTHPDFTHYVKTQRDGEGNEVEIFTDLCGFRVAGLSRVTIAGATSVMSGEADSQPRTLFAVTAQVPRHKNILQRRVFEDEKLHNVEQWKKFGPVFSQNQFFRMVNILERTAELGARDAINFVGLAWRQKRLTINEGPDCYFTEPEKQCPYHNLVFSSGSVFDARRVIAAYQETFTHNAAAMLLVWGLGGHLKALLGFWPHMILQSNKGAGKSTLIKRLERTLDFTMFSGQSLQTEFRLLTSISHTSHPVGWEEISARQQKVIDTAVALLQENYQYTTTRRGSDMTEYLLSAPVLLAGEDVPVRSLLGKVVKTDITGKKGPMMPQDLPKFPVREWLEYLARCTRAQVMETYDKARLHCLDKSRAKKGDDGASRMAGNYAAVLTAWRLLCDFAGIDMAQGGLIPDVLQEMNGHIAETSAEREPWVWIMEIMLSELEAGNYRLPYRWDVEGFGAEEEPCLFIRTSHVIDHLSSTPSLRDKWNAMPVKSDRVFKRQLKEAGVIYIEDAEKSISGRRVSHMVGISLRGLARYGLHASPPEEMNGTAA